MMTVTLIDHHSLSVLPSRFVVVFLCFSFSLPKGPDFFRTLYVACLLVLSTPLWPSIGVSLFLALALAILSLLLSLALDSLSPSPSDLSLLVHVYIHTYICTYLRSLSHFLSFSFYISSLEFSRMFSLGLAVTLARFLILALRMVLDPFPQAARM